MRTIGVGIVVGLLVVSSSPPARAQHHPSFLRSHSNNGHSHSHVSVRRYEHSHPHLPFAYEHPHQIQLTTYPGYNSGGYPRFELGRTIGFSFGRPYGYLPYLPQPVQVIPAAPPVGAPPLVVPLAFGPVEPKPAVSSPAARMRSLEFQVRGDQRMREQKWGEARAAYASAVSAAPDRAEAHLRLAICFVVVRRFDSAIGELKRAVILDQGIPVTGKRLDELLGPGSQIVRNAILARLGEWVAEDVHATDRLYLLGAVLHFMGDPRAREYLEAALHSNSDSNKSHISCFLNPPAKALKDPVAEGPAGLPKLNDQPAPVPHAPSANDEVRPLELPVPLSDTPVPLTIGLSATP